LTPVYAVPVTRREGLQRTIAKLPELLRKPDLSPHQVLALKTKARPVIGLYHQSSNPNFP
jgi:hypothetical protein